MWIFYEARIVLQRYILIELGFEIKFVISVGYCLNLVPMYLNYKSWLSNARLISYRNSFCRIIVISFNSYLWFFFYFIEFRRVPPRNNLFCYASKHKTISIMGPELGNTKNPRLICNLSILELFRFNSEIKVDSRI